MNCDAVTVKAPADPMGVLGAGLSPQNCPNLRLGDQAFISVHPAVTGHMDCAQEGDVVLREAGLFSSG